MLRRINRTYISRPLQQGRLFCTESPYPPSKIVSPISEIRSSKLRIPPGVVSATVITRSGGSGPIRNKFLPKSLKYLKFEDGDKGMDPRSFKSLDALFVNSIDQSYCGMVKPLKEIYINYPPRFKPILHDGRLLAEKIFIHHQGVHVADHSREIDYEHYLFEYYVRDERFKYMGWDQDMIKARDEDLFICGPKTLVPCPFHKEGVWVIKRTPRSNFQEKE